MAAGAAPAAAPPADPRIEIGALLGVRKYEDALVKALNTASLEVLVWACKQVRGLLGEWRGWAARVHWVVGAGQLDVLVWVCMGGQLVVGCVDGPSSMVLGTREQWNTCAAAGRRSAGCEHRQFGFFCAAADLALLLLLP
jgi:hypothetical protein